jgi:hypothetical protein
VTKGTALTADVLKDSAPAPKDVQPILAVNIEEGEILVGEMLMALRGGEARGGSSAPPSDKEVEALEGMAFDESGKFHLTCSPLPKVFLLMLFFAAISASMQQLLAMMHGPGATEILPPEKGVGSCFIFGF